MTPEHRALQAVIDLHAPVVRVADGGGTCCPRCYDDPTWPCKTIRAITRELASEQPDGSGCGCGNPIPAAGPSPWFVDELHQNAWFLQQRRVAKSGSEEVPAWAEARPPAELGEQAFREAFAEIYAERPPVIGVTTPGDPWSDIVDTYQRIMSHWPADDVFRRHLDAFTEENDETLRRLTDVPPVDAAPEPTTYEPFVADEDWRDVHDIATPQARPWWHRMFPGGTR